MTLKAYLIAMSSATAACWASWFFVINMINPETTNWIGFCLFYFSLFLSLLGSAALAGFVIRFVALRQELLFRLVKDAFRQSFLFSFLIVFSLFLLSRNLLSTLNLILLAIGLSTLEFFLISYKKEIKYAK